MRILFVSANPGDRDQLVLEEEYRAIEQRIRRARHRDAFRLIVCPAARRSDLQDALLEHAPHVVHFACHGSRQGALSLLGENPTSAPVSTESLAAMFEVANDQLLLVVFNACFASIQAAAIRPFAKATIGMRAQVTDRASIAFASALYGALAYGRSVQQAFALGVAALDAPESGSPEIFEQVPGEAQWLHLVARGRLRAAMLAVGVLIAIGVAARVAVTVTPKVTKPVPVAVTRPLAIATPAPAPEPPFVLDAQLKVHRRQGGRSITLEERRSGEIIMDGDQLQLSAKTSSDGYLYLAFCSLRSQIKGLPGLSVFPSQGEIRLNANQTTPVPAEIIVDNHPGPETLYVIFSRSKLSQSDARLAEVLTIEQRKQSTAECGTQFRRAIEGSRGEITSGELKGAQRGGRSEGDDAARRDKPAVARGFEVTSANVPPGVDADADADGIVVLRYEFTHVPRPKPQ